ncbi:MAG: phosphoserine phosphatase SerB, partial [Muribaculaceae bacterium]|nr:phosphoserine phosphatase SerB [Muribaculaceae bacterium]
MEAPFELILINVAGADRPGVTSALTEILAKYDAAILDIGQADIHHALSLGFLVKTDEHASGNMMKDLLFKATELNVQVRFSPVSVSEYNAWVDRQGKNRWIITILGRRLTAKHISMICHLYTSRRPREEHESR